MRRLLVALLVLAACSGPTVVATTTTVGDTTTTQAEITTTTVPHQEVAIQDCSSPPVTFSTLCEVYELLDTWYVDSPLDPDLLAEVAVRGLGEYITEEPSEPPRTLFCAIPDEAFTRLCHEIGDRVATQHMPVGPAVETAVAYMVDVALDPFTYYLSPEQAGALRLNGIVGGIGVLLDARDAAGSKCTQVTAVCRLEVVTVLEDNPGAAAGLVEGDIITAVDGVDVEGKGFTSVVAEIAGDETGTVELTIDRSEEVLEVTIERAELIIPTVEYTVPMDGVGYLRIPDFEADIPGLVVEALEEITAEHLSTIVVDLRDNPGGLVDAVIEVAGQFLDGGVAMVSEAPGEYFEHEVGPGGAATTQRLVVLVNQGTASAAEVLTGALRDRRGAVVVGSDTFGKDAIQIPFELRNGGEFYVVVAHWSTPDGDTAAIDGLQPDHEVSWPDGATVEEVVGLALEAAS